jgi:hypothetical protein
MKTIHTRQEKGKRKQLTKTTEAVAPIPTEHDKQSEKEMTGERLVHVCLEEMSFG